MKISIIIPAYNTSKYIEKCIFSIINQTYKDTEIIVVDDGSTDDTLKICQNIANNYANVKVFHQQNKGVSVARNLGLDNATGEYITFVDSDDYLDDNMYESMMELIIKNKADIVHCGYKRVDRNGSVLKYINGTKEILVQKPEDAICYALEGIKFNSSLCTKFISRKLLDDIRFNTELNFNEDVVVNFLVFQKANKIVFFDNCFYSYFIRSDSATSSNNYFKIKKDHISAIQIMNEACKFKKVGLVLQKQLFCAYLDYCRICIFENVNKEEYKYEREWLKNNYSKTSNINKTTRINYFLIMKFSGIYKFIYGIYNKLRKPKWDPQ